MLGVFWLAKNGSDLTILQVILFGCCSLDTFLAILVVLGTFASLHSESTDTVNYLQTEFSEKYVAFRRHGSKQLKMRLISLIPLHVKLGSVNYIDQMTPMTLFEFCIDQLINLLLCT